MNTFLRLINDLQNDKSFSQELQTLADQPEAFTTLLARRGYEFSAQDLSESSTLSDEALGSFSGGSNGNGAIVETVQRMLKAR